MPRSREEHKCGLCNFAVIWDPQDWIPAPMRPSVVNRAQGVGEGLCAAVAQGCREKQSWEEKSVRVVILLLFTAI